MVRICAEARLPIVPQGGNTGLVGGGVPPEDGTNIVLALGRMNRIRAIDPVNFTMTVEAGCILAHLQQGAAAKSAAICRPMPAASRYCATAIRAS